MKRIALAVLLSLCGAALLGMGGQSVPMGALPVALGTSAPTTTCSAMVNVNPYTTPASNTTGAGAVVVSVGFYTGTGAALMSVTDNKGNGSATALPVYKGNDVAVATLYYVLPTVGTGHTFTITSNAGSPYAGVAMRNCRAWRNHGGCRVISGSGGSGDNCSTGAVTLTGGGYAAISSFAFANVPVTSVNNAFTIGGSLAGVTATYIGDAEAYLKAAAGSLNPTWTATGQNDVGACSIISFH